MLMRFDVFQFPQHKNLSLLYPSSIINDLYDYNANRRGEGIQADMHVCSM